MEKRKVDIRTVIQDSVALSKSFAKLKGITIEVNSKPSVPAVIETDEKRLKEIIVQHLRCMTKLTHHGKVCLKVKLMKRERKDWLKFTTTSCSTSLSDEGINNLLLEPITSFGIDRQLRISLFTSKKLIESFGGEFIIKSKEHGSSFVFILPIHSQAVKEKTNHIRKMILSRKIFGRLGNLAFLVLMKLRGH